MCPCAGQPGWARTAADASINVLVNAVTRPGVNDPTLKVADPRQAGMEVEGENDMQEDLALDLSRKPRPELLSSWVEAAQSVDPFKVRLATIPIVAISTHTYYSLSYPPLLLSVGGKRYEESICRDQGMYITLHSRADRMMKGGRI